MEAEGRRVEVGEVLSKTWSLFVWNVVELVSVVAVIYSPYILYVLIRGGSVHRIEASLPFLLDRFTAFDMLVASGVQRLAPGQPEPEDSDLSSRLRTLPLHPAEINRTPASISLNIADTA